MGRETRHCHGGRINQTKQSMKALAKTVFYCEHCKKHYLAKHACINHEEICSRNPANQRPCFDCHHLIKTEARAYYQSCPEAPETITVEILYCKHMDLYLHPPKWEIRNRKWDIVEGENFPMPKQCKHQKNIFTTEP